MHTCLNDGSRFVEKRAVLNERASSEPTSHSTLYEHDLVVEVLVETRELLGVIVLEEHFGLADLPVLEAELVQDVAARLFGGRHVRLQRVDEYRVAFDEVLVGDAIGEAQAPYLGRLEHARVLELNVHRLRVEIARYLVLVWTYASFFVLFCHLN